MKGMAGMSAGNQNNAARRPGSDASMKGMDMKGAELKGATSPAEPR